MVISWGGIGVGFGGHRKLEEAVDIENAPRICLFPWDTAFELRAGVPDVPTYMGTTEARGSPRKLTGAKNRLVAPKIRIFPGNTASELWVADHIWAHRNPRHLAGSKNRMIATRIRIFPGNTMSGLRFCTRQGDAYMESRRPRKRDEAKNDPHPPRNSILSVNTLFELGAAAPDTPTCTDAKEAKKENR